MGPALSKDFSPKNPYSKLCAANINFRGPIYKTHFVNESGVMTEVVDEELNEKEAKLFIRAFLYRVYTKAQKF